jgi:hypothetical protein
MKRELFLDTNLERSRRAPGAAYVIFARSRSRTKMLYLLLQILTKKYTGRHNMTKFESSVEYVDFKKNMYSKDY